MLFELSRGVNTSDIRRSTYVDSAPSPRRLSDRLPHGYTTATPRLHHGYTPTGRPGTTEIQILPPVHPLAALPQAVLAALGRAGRDVARLPEVGAGPVGGLALGVRGDHPTGCLLAHDGLLPQDAHSS